MITEQKLTELGFSSMRDEFTGKTIWVLGEEDAEIFGDPSRLPVVIYDVKSQTCKTVRDEYSLVCRTCRTEEEIRQFVDAINFLFRTNVVVDSRKPIDRVLSDAIKQSYDKIKDQLEPPL